MPTFETALMSLIQRWQLLGATAAELIAALEQQAERIGEEAADEKQLGNQQGDDE